MRRRHALYLTDQARPSLSAPVQAAETLVAAAVQPGPVATPPPDPAQIEEVVKLRQQMIGMRVRIRKAEANGR